MEYEVNEPLVDENKPKTLNKIVDPFINARIAVVFSILGSLGLTAIAIVLASILNNFNLSQALFDTAVHLSTYSLLLIIMMLILWNGKVLKPLALQFTKLRPYLYGVGYGFIVIFTSVIYSQIITLIFGVTESNENQNAVVSLITSYPILSALWIPFIGPLVEELTYRMGLFNLVRHFNKKLAYVAVAVVFGLIHFNIPFAAGGGVDVNGLIIELANLPNYMISGLLFSYIYDKENFATASVAHITNNFVSYISTIIVIYG